MILNDNEANVALKYLSYITEAYQFFSHFVLEILNGIKLDKPKFSPDRAEFFSDISKCREDYFSLVKEDFEEMAIAFSELEKNLFNEANVFSQALFDEMFGDRVLAKRAYDLQKNVAQSVLLAKEIEAVLLQITNFFHTKSEAESLGASEIAKGVVGTLDIKIEIINEGISEIQASCNAILSKMMAKSEFFENVAAETGNETVKEKFVRLFYENIDFGLEKITSESVENIVNLALETEELADVIKEFESGIETVSARVLKEIFAFKHDIVLYECATFGEILSYSITHLRESSDENILEFVEFVDSASKTLTAVLNKNNIAVISPNPKEPFNPREHEVLIAEQLEGFEKSEIIKVLTNGYKEDDRVIMRASVVAAK